MHDRDTLAIPAGPDAAAAWSAYRHRRHFASLDGVRCLSILAVIWHHSPHPAIAPWTRGFLGVDLFFVLSGFLITTLLLRERDHHGRVSLSRFYARRTLRIFPLYYAFLLAMLAGLAWLAPDRPLTRGVFEVAPYYLTYTSNWAPVEESLFHHSWSLAVEEQFYLLWPPLFALLDRRLTVALLLLFLGASEAVDFGLLDSLDPDRWWAVRLAAFSAITIGVLLANALHSAAGFRAAHALARHRWFVLVPAASLLALMHVDGDIDGPARLGVHLSMATLLAAVVVNERHLGRRLLQWQPIVHIGVVSYAMYLMHMLCLIASRKVLALFGTQHVLPFFTLGVLLTVSVASLSFFTFERFFLRWKSRFSASEPPPTRGRSTS